MFKKLHTLSLALAFTAIGTSSFNAQLKVPAPSPLQTVKQAFALSDITIEYSRPSAKGRVIYGDLVPFGSIWRTGANASTKITFGEDVKVQGNAIAAGTYAMYTIPNKDTWEILFYKDLKLGGDVANYKPENELLRFTVPASKLNDKVETFSIGFAAITPSTCSIELTWENTRVAIAVLADIDSKIMKNIETNVINDNRPYYQAANYYYETNRDLIMAATWADKAIAANPKAYWIVLLKAKIQTKQKDSKGAIATAEQVIALAKDDKNDDYVKQAEKLIAENKK